MRGTDGWDWEGISARRVVPGVEVPVFGRRVKNKKIFRCTSSHQSSPDARRTAVLEKESIESFTKTRQHHTLFHGTYLNGIREHGRLVNSDRVDTAQWCTRQPGRGVIYLNSRAEGQVVKRNIILLQKPLVLVEMLPTTTLYALQTPRRFTTEFYKETQTL